MRFASRMLAGFALLAGAGLPAAHAAIFPFIPDHYTFSRRQIEQTIDRKFPYRRQEQQLFDLTLFNPALSLEASVNRVAVRIQARIVSPFLDQPVQGAFTVDSALGYDAQQRAIVLRDPRVTNVDTGQLNAVYAAQVNQLAAAAGAQWLNGYRLYTFKPEELSFAGVHYVPGDITVLRDGIRIQVVELGTQAPPTANRAGPRADPNTGPGVTPAGH